MPRLLLTSLALAAGLFAQSPLESSFVVQYILTTTPTPITALCDLTVSDPQGIVVHQLDVRVNTQHGTSAQLGVWVTQVGGTHVGNQQNPLAWTQVSTASREHNGGRVAFVLDTPFYLAPGTYGLALHCVGMNPVFVDGTTQTPPLPDTYSTAEATFDMTSARIRQSGAVDPFAGTNVGYSPGQPNVAVHYVVGARYLDFAADTTGGGSPLDVQFTSYAASGAPGGIAAYAWDFDNDSVIDSTAPNPLHTFTSCGNYTVSLTILDVNGSLTETKADYIVTDVVSPDFSNTVVAPGFVQFLDTSSPAPTAWAWDLNGDGVTDSTLQHPLFDYGTSCNEVTVSLTVSRACRPPVTITRRIAVATSVETTFAGGLITAAGAASAANYFDVAISEPQGVTVCGVHVHSSLAAGTPVTVNLYQTDGSYVGKTGDAAAWRLVASETVSSAGVNARTFVPLSAPLHLAAGAYGVCMEHVGGSPYYTAFGAPQVYSDGAVTITAGLTQAGPVFDAASLTYSPRVANIALHYSTSATTGAPGYGFVAPGCAGSLGVPTNTASTLATLGGTCTIEVANLPFGLGVMALGLARVDPSLDLALIGMPACPLHHTAEATVTMVGAGTSAQVLYPIPLAASLVGVQVYTQALSYDPGINALGFAISDAAVMLVGN